MLTALALVACSIEHIDPVLTGVSESDGDGDAGPGSAPDGGSTTSAADVPTTSGGSMTAGGDESTATGGDDSTATGGDETGSETPLGPCVPWVRVIDTTDPTQEMRGLAADAAGNVVIVGEFRGDAVDFGAGPMDSSQGQMYVAKYGPDGAALWSRQFGPGGGGIEVYTRGVVFDAGGNVVVVGNHWGGIDFGDGSLPISPGGPSAFIAKFDPDGEHVWSRGFAATDQSVQAASLAADATGGVVFVMAAGQPIDLGSGPVGVSGHNTLIARLADDGALVWSASFTGEDYQGNAAWPRVAFDPGGAVVLAGRHEHSVDFGGGVIDFGEEFPVFVARLTPGGALEWVKHSTGMGVPDVANIGIDGSGRIHLGGYIRAPFAFGGPLLVPTSHDDVAAVLLDGAGEHLWSERYGSGFDSGQRIDALAVNAAGERLVAGEFLGTIDLGGGELAPAAGPSDIFVARQGPLGEHRWSRALGGEGLMYVLGAAIDANGDGWIGGVHEGELIIGDQVFDSGEVQYQIYVVRMCADDLP